MRKFLFCFLFVLLLQACSSQPDLVGRWRTAPPSSMLFEIRPDRSVLLYQDGQVYRVFNLKVIDRDTLQLFDGMGRPRQLDFQLLDDRLYLVDRSGSEKRVEIWTREP